MVPCPPPAPGLRYSDSTCRTCYEVGRRAELEHRLWALTTDTAREVIGVEREIIHRLDG